MDTEDSLKRRMQENCTYGSVEGRRQQCQSSTQQEIPGEWHRTGDLGYIDSNGELFITGRTDNMIVTGSHNVFPETVEQTIIEKSGRYAYLFNLQASKYV